VEHAEQRDGESCGIFCLKFAECMIIGNEEITKEVFVDTDVVNYREKVVETPLNEGGEHTWCQQRCRACGNEDGPKLAKKQRNDRWVQCEVCVPDRWFHENCIGNEIPHKNSSFCCSDVVYKNDYMQSWNSDEEVKVVKVVKGNVKAVGSINKKERQPKAVGSTNKKKRQVKAVGSIKKKERQVKAVGSIDKKSMEKVEEEKMEKELFLKLKVGESMVRKRRDRRIRKCGGCIKLIREDPLFPPLNIVVAKKCVCPKAGTKREDNDSVETKKPFHMNQKCLTAGDISMESITVPCFLKENIYATYCKELGLGVLAKKFLN